VSSIKEILVPVAEALNFSIGIQWLIVKGVGVKFG
jgi:hypothetical protein